MEAAPPATPAWPVLVAGLLVSAGCWLPFAFDALLRWRERRAKRIESLTDMQRFGGADRPPSEGFRWHDSEDA
jgi:hypothetical protein